MIRPSLQEPLKPLLARTPRLVREHEILRVSAKIMGSDQGKVTEIARREILKWAQKRCGGQLPREAWSAQDFEYLSGGRNSVGVRIKNDDADVWAIRADDPDKKIAGRVWTTEVVIGSTKDEVPRVSARLLVSTAESTLVIEPHSPGFLQQLTDSCGLSQGNYEINSVPWTIRSDEECDHLIEMLRDADRRVPVFVLTTQGNLDPLLDAISLSRALLGIGYVVVVPGAFTWALTQRFGRQRSVFGGAVRAYLPGFNDDANPYAHRLVLAEHLANADGVSQCTRWMRWLAAAESIRTFALGTDVLGFAEIRNASLIRKQKQLRDEGASEIEQLRAANDRIRALEAQTEDLKASLEYFDTEHKDAEERAEAAEEQARASAFRIQQLLHQVDGDAKDQNPPELPKSWQDFIGWCDLQLAGRVALSPLARRGIRSPEFEDVQTAARCLQWLANEGRERRMTGGEGSLRDEAVEDGIRNAHCGADQFDLTWQGQRHTADWHIKNGGNTRDPKRCLRIYIFGSRPRSKS